MHAFFLLALCYQADENNLLILNVIYIAALKTEFTKCFESFKQKQETQEDNITELTVNSQAKHKKVFSKVS